MMKFDYIDNSNKYLEEIISIIRYGIYKRRFNLSKDTREGLNTQKLVDAFNYAGTIRQNSHIWIGVQKENEHGENLYREDVYFYLNDDEYTRIFYIEAKRLPKYKTSEDEEYVTGMSKSNNPSGGIERYKLGLHGNYSHRNIGMIAYIENKSIDEWFDIINKKIEAVYPNDSKLASIINSEFISTHSYIKTKGNFTIYHFWIDLT